ncbi:hypothetical protein B9479_000941 [Cryptococcus floricola]|uniref:Uncharacterized protein n=1 Tax=Cryptococcus floricola TaxID=2591691 RepID=A0A5D3B3Q6_9TREE|nr:hypothetical protein B9479_000941 [Cryptococcus floricola]
MSSFYLPPDFNDVIPESDQSSYRRSQAYEYGDQQPTYPGQLYQEPHVFGDSRWTAGNSSTSPETDASKWGDGGWPIDICQKADRAEAGQAFMGGLSGTAATSQRRTTRQSTLSPESLPFNPSLIDASEPTPQLHKYPALQPSDTYPTTSPSTLTDHTHLSPTSHPSIPARRRQRHKGVPYTFTHDPVEPFSLPDHEEGSDNIGSGDVRDSDMPEDQLKDHWKTVKGGRMGAMNSQQRSSRYGPRN